MEFLLGAAVGCLAMAAGAALRERFLLQRKRQSAQIPPEEGKEKAGGALEEQWNNMMRFDGTAQHP